MRALKILCFCLMLTIYHLNAAAAGTLLYVPIDNRPVNFYYPLQTMRAAGWDVQTPPAEYLAGIDNPANCEKIMDWLEENGKTSTAIVVSSDALLYGGLVGSRTHSIDSGTLLNRTERLLSLKETTHNQKVFIFTTIMRSPKASSAPAEPAYYKQWGSQLFRLGALEDKADLRVLRRSERKELEQLREEIPADILDDLYKRRGTNIKMTELLLHGVESGEFDYMLLGRDDTADFSQAHREARAMDILVHELPKGKIRFLAGADELGLMLLQRAASRLRFELPLVNVTYAAGKAGATVASYEDNTVAESAIQHILAAGGFPARIRRNADLVLAINTPKNGICLEAADASNSSVPKIETRAFVGKVDRLLSHGYKVAIADVKYGNGADNSLVPLLFKRNIAYKLAAYGGWNTSGNTIGFALSQGLLSENMHADDKTTLLEQRYLDDWAYQSNARMQIYQKIIWPQSWPNGGLKDDKLQTVEAAVSDSIKAVAKPVMGEAAEAYEFTLPWQRMFEVKVSK